jgi:hypothetical protein
MKRTMAAPRRSRTRRAAICLVLVCGSATMAGCERHNVALNRACPSGSWLRAATLPKIGLTRAELKLQQKEQCK